MRYRALAVIAILAAGALAVAAFGQSHEASATPLGDASIKYKSFLFTEQPTVGKMSGTLVLPANSVLFAVSFHGVTSWFDTTATLEVKDQAGVLWSGEEAFATDQGLIWFAPDRTSQASTSQGIGINYPSGQTITVSYTTTVAGSPTGKSGVELLYAPSIQTANVP